MNSGGRFNSARRSRSPRARVAAATRATASRTASTKALPARTRVDPMTSPIRAATGAPEDSE